MSATSAPRYFSHVNVSHASSGTRGSPAGGDQPISGTGSAASFLGDGAPVAPVEYSFDSGAPTDVDEGVPGAGDSPVSTSKDAGRDAAADVMPTRDPGSLPEQERPAATSSVSAEAQQGDGPAAASASASAVGQTPQTMTVSVVVGPNGAAASGPFGVVVVGAGGAAAASAAGVAAVGPDGAASASNAANSTRAVVHRGAARTTSEDE